MTKHSIHETLKQHKLTPHKRLGQNFLIKPHTAAQIANLADISPEETVVEVGVGLGALTTPLAKLAGRVIGIEIDRGLIRYHEQKNTLADNVTLQHGDVLKMDFANISEMCGGTFTIVANLPYSISNPFIFKIIENRQHISKVLVMLQKEVAERLTAPPCTKEYGVPTILLNSCATVTKLFTLGPQEFHPRPKIDSVVICIDFNKCATGSTQHCSYDFNLFQKIVRTAFAQRRKTLLNNLSEFALDLNKTNKKAHRTAVTKAIESAGLAPSTRAETLSVFDFIILTVELAKISGAK